MNDETISKVLGLRPLEEAKTDLEVYEEKRVLPAEFIDPEDDETVRDIETARGNVKSILDRGDDALQEIISIAKQSESPRAFEVVSTLMKTLLDANKDFVDLSHKKKYAKEEITKPQQAAQTNITNNNLILSTADLLKMIKGD